MRASALVTWHDEEPQEQFVALYAAHFVVEGIVGVFEEEVVELTHVESIQGTSDGGRPGIILLVSDGHHSTTQIVARLSDAAHVQSWLQALTRLTAGNGLAARPPAAAPQPIVPRDAGGQMAYDVDALVRRVDATLTRIPAPPLARVQQQRVVRGIPAGDAAYPAPRFSRMAARQTWATQSSPSTQVRRAPVAGMGLATRSGNPAGAQWSATLRRDFHTTAPQVATATKTTQYGYGTMSDLTMGRLKANRLAGKISLRGTNPPPPLMPEAAETLERYLQWVETTAQTRRLVRTSRSLVQAAQSGYFLLQLIAALRPRSGTALRAAEPDASIAVRKFESNASNMKMAIDIVMRGPVNKARIPPPSYLAKGDSEAVACFIEEVFYAFEYRQVSARANASIRWLSNIIKRYGKELEMRNINAPYYGLARKIRGGTLFACVLHYFCGDGRSSFPPFDLATIFEAPASAEQEAANLERVWAQLRSLGILVPPPPAQFLRTHDLELILVQIDRIHDRFKGESSALGKTTAGRDDGIGGRSFGEAPYLQRVDVSFQEMGTWHERLVTRGGDRLGRGLSGYRYALRVANVVYRSLTNFAPSSGLRAATDHWSPPPKQRTARAIIDGLPLSPQQIAELAAEQPPAPPLLPAVEPAIPSEVMAMRAALTIEDQRSQARRAQASNYAQR